MSAVLRPEVLPGRSELVFLPGAAVPVLGHALQHPPGAWPLGSGALRVGLVLVRERPLGLASRVQTAKCETPAVEDHPVDPLLDILAAGGLDNLAYGLARPGAVRVLRCLAQDLTDEPVPGAE